MPCQREMRLGASAAELYVFLVVKILWFVADHRRKVRSALRRLQICARRPVDAVEHEFLLGHVATAG